MTTTYTLRPQESNEDLPKFAGAREPAGFGGRIIGAINTNGRFIYSDVTAAVDAVKTVSRQSENTELAWFAAAVTVVTWKYTDIRIRHVFFGVAGESASTRISVEVDPTSSLVQLAKRIDSDLCGNKHRAASSMPFWNVRINPLTLDDTTQSIVEFGLHICLEHGRLSGCLKADFGRAYYDENLVARFSQNVVHLCQRLPETNQSTIAELEIVCPAEKKQIEGFNETRTEYPREATIVAVFEECVKRFAKTPALISHDLEFNFEQLNSCSNQLAARLCQVSLRNDDVVAVIADRSPSAVVGMLAALKAGACYMPINHRDPVIRRREMLTKSHARAVLFEQGLAIDPKTLRVGSVQKVLPIDLSIPSHFTGNLAKGASSTNLAYVMYTSGTSGVAKAVMVEHRGVVRLVLNTNYFDFRPDTRILHTSAIEFDAATFEIWGSLLNGLTLYIASRDDVLSPTRLREVIDKWQITTILLTTPLFAQFASMSPNLFGSLRNLLVGGDRLLPQHTNTLLQRFPNLKIINGYGPTENTTFSTTFLVDREFAESIPIGRPIANSTVYILDENLHLLPIGAIGELFTGGDGVAKGYLNDDKLTEERFPAYAGEARIYRTGDLARWLPDGNIDFIGRRDDQLKIHGFRIDPAEIESVLRKHSKVKDAVVLGIENEAGEKNLVAFLAVDESLTTSQTRDFLSTRLPEYMIPSRFVILQKLPLTASGKVNRSDLLKEFEGPCTGAGAPRTDIPEKLLCAWNDVIGYQEADRTENFFEAGGNSMKAIRLLNRVESDFSVEVSMRKFLGTPTLTNLYQLILKGAAVRDEKQIERRPPRPWYELSVSQNRLIELWEKHPHSASFNCPQRIFWNQPVKESTIRQVLNELVARHDIFRTRLVKKDNRYVQVIGSDREMRITTIDLSAASGLEQRKKTNDLFVRESVTPIQLDGEALYRANLIKLGESKFELHLTVHHIVFDGWSKDVLLREFDKLYTDFSAGRPSSLEPVVYQFKDFVGWQNQLLSDSTRCHPLIAFWKDYLHDYSKRVSPPYDQPGAAAGTSRESSGFRFVISDETTRKLRIFASMNDTTLFMVLYAGFNILLCKLTNENDIVTGTPSANRRHELVQNTMGFFVDGVLVRIKFDGFATFSEFLSSVNDNVLKSLEFAHYPVEKACEAVGTTWPEILASFFNMSTFGDSNRATLDNREWKHFPQVQESKLEFVFYLSEFVNGVEVNVHYYNKLYSPDRVEEYVREYVRILEEIAENRADSLLRTTESVS